MDNNTEKNPLLSQNSKQKSLFNNQIYCSNPHHEANLNNNKLVAEYICYDPTCTNKNFNLACSICYVNQSQFKELHKNHTIIPLSKFVSIFYEFHHIDDIYSSNDQNEVILGPENKNYLGIHGILKKVRTTIIKSLENLENLVLSLPKTPSSVNEKDFIILSQLVKNILDEEKILDQEAFVLQSKNILLYYDEKTRFNAMSNVLEYQLGSLEENFTDIIDNINRNTENIEQRIRQYRLRPIPIIESIDAIKNLDEGKELKVQNKKEILRQKMNFHDDTYPINKKIKTNKYVQALSQTILNSYHLKIEDWGNQISQINDEAHLVIGGKGIINSRGREGMALAKIEEGSLNYSVNEPTLIVEEINEKFDIINSGFKSSEIDNLDSPKIHNLQSKIKFFEYNELKSQESDNLLEQVKSLEPNISGAATKPSELNNSKNESKSFEPINTIQDITHLNKKIQLTDSDFDVFKNKPIESISTNKIASAINKSFSIRLLNNNFNAKIQRINKIASNETSYIAKLLEIIDSKDLQYHDFCFFEKDSNHLNIEFIADKNIDNYIIEMDPKLAISIHNSVYEFNNNSILTVRSFFKSFSLNGDISQAHSYVIITFNDGIIRLLQERPPSRSNPKKYYIESWSYIHMSNIPCVEVLKNQFIIGGDESGNVLIWDLDDLSPQPIKILKHNLDTNDSILGIHIFIPDLEISNNSISQRVLIHNCKGLVKIYKLEFFLNSTGLKVDNFISIYEYQDSNLQTVKNIQSTSNHPDFIFYTCNNLLFKKWISNWQTESRRKFLENQAFKDLFIIEYGIYTLFLMIKENRSTNQFSILWLIVTTKFENLKSDETDKYDLKGYIKGQLVFEKGKLRLLYLCKLNNQKKIKLCEFDLETLLQKVKDNKETHNSLKSFSQPILYN